MDEGMLLVHPELVLHGKLPYRDFDEVYGPANLWLLGGVYAFFEPAIPVERAVGLLYRVAILVAMFGLVQRWGTSLAMGCTLLAAVLLVGTGLPAFAWMGGMACALTSFWIMAGGTSRCRMLSGGLLLGAGLLFRPDLAPAVLLASLPLLLPLGWNKRFTFALGGAIALGPLAGLALAAGLQQTFDSLFLFPVLHSARHLPLSSVEPFVVRAFFLHLAAVALNLSCAAIALRAQPGSRQNQVLLAITLFAAGITHQAFQRLDPAHLRFAAFLSIGMLPLTLSMLMRRLNPRFPCFHSTAGSVAAVVALLCAACFPITTYFVNAIARTLQTEDMTLPSVEIDGRSFRTPTAEYARALQALLSELDGVSVAGERLFVGPADLRRTNYCDTFIYYLIPKLEPASYFMVMNPLSANRPGSRLAADIQTADWLVLNKAWDNAQEPNRSSEYGSAKPNHVVQENFRLIGAYGSYSLFRRKS